MPAPNRSAPRASPPARGGHIVDPYHRRAGEHGPRGRGQRSGQRSSTGAGPPFAVGARRPRNDLRLVPQYRKASATNSDRWCSRDRFCPPSCRSRSRIHPHLTDTAVAGLPARPPRTTAPRRPRPRSGALLHGARRPNMCMATIPPRGGGHRPQGGRDVVHHGGPAPTAASATPGFTVSTETRTWGRGPRSPAPPGGTPRLRRPARPRAGSTRRHVDQVGPLGHHLEPARAPSRVEVPASVGEGVGRHVQDAHHEGRMGRSVEPPAPARARSGPKSPTGFFIGRARIPWPRPGSGGPHGTGPAPPM